MSDRPPPELAELRLTVQSVSVLVPPSLYRPPPLPAVEPPEMIRPLKVAVTPLSTWNTRLVPPPLIVTPAAGPVIVSVPLVLLSSSWPCGQRDRLGRGEDGRVEGDGPARKVVGERRSRRAVWSRRSEKSSPSAVVVTTKLGTMATCDSNAPMSTVPLKMRDSPRWSVVMPAGMRALLPASMAGLPRSRAIVSVGPP